MPTVAELKIRADKLGITYSSKVRKPELELMVTEGERARERAAASRIEPMSNAARESHYRQQYSARQGRQCVGYVLTPRQARRIRKADNRARGRRVAQVSTDV